MMPKSIMDETVLSPSWWITAVVAGVMASLVAAYLKPRMDRFLSSISTRWATRTAKKRIERAARIRRLYEDPHEELVHYQEAGFRGRQAQWFMILVVAGMIALPEVVNSPIFGWIVVFSLLSLMFMGMNYWSEQQNLMGEIHAARRMRQKQTTKTGRSEPPSLPPEGEPPTVGVTGLSDEPRER